MNKITCDQVAWLLDIANRYLPPDSFPRISRQRDMNKYGMLYEIMDVLNLQFEDASALYNGTPPDLRPPFENREETPNHTKEKENENK